MFIKIFALALLASQAFACSSTCSEDRGDAYCPVPKVYKVERPCPKFDICCVQKYFLENGHCKKPTSETPSLKIDRAFLPLPSFNFTIVQEPVEFCGSNDAEIVEFYVNHETDVVLLSLRFGPMVVKGVNHVIQHNPRKEFTIINDSYNTTVTYEYAQTTTQFKKCLDLEGSKTHIDVPLPSKMDVCKCNENNDALNNVLATVHQNMATSTIELFVPRGYNLARYWIQRFICDYGVDPIAPIITYF